MHRFTFYAISLIAVILFISVIVPYFSLIAIVLIVVLFSIQDRKPGIKRQTSSDPHIHIPIESVPPEFYRSYRRYLISDKWKALRSIVLVRDSHTCQGGNSSIDAMDLGLFLVITQLMHGSMGGMVIGAIAQVIISFYLLIFPPKFSNAVK